MNVSLDAYDSDNVHASYDSGSSYPASSERPSDSTTTGQLVNKRSDSLSAEGLDSGDRHGRLLLAALLENFCRLYESEPKKSERLFATLCKTLSAMGILDQENVGELAGIRSYYSRAFKQLMLQAKEAVDREDLKNGVSRRLSASYANTDDTKSDGNDGSNSLDIGEKNDIFSNACSGSRLSLSEWLGYEDTKYNSEFEEIGLLGKGGFGSVYHCRNKIDSAEYAVKQISMRRASTNHAKVYREIKTLARLEHPNIVRYFSSWLEHSTRPTARRRERTISRDAASSGRQQAGHDDLLFLMDHEDPSFSSGDQRDADEPEDSGGIVFEASDDEEADMASEFISTTSLDPEPFSSRSRARQDSRSSRGTGSSMTISLDQEAFSMPSVASGFHSRSFSGSIEEIARPNNNSPFSMSLPHRHSKFNRRRRKSESTACLTLFIQMHLCPMTLRDHIRARNAAYCAAGSTYKDSLSPRSYIDLFRAILEGSKYVHRSGLCHRDIKPSNIFLASVDESDRSAIQILDPETVQAISVVPKLGDFGLVLPTAHDAIEEDEDEDGVGTAIYGAPEQFTREGEAFKVYQMTSKCDVFALGIVFFEMLHFTSTTAMERAKLLSELRHGVLPESFVQTYPAESALILVMTCIDPNKRPSVEEILEMEIVVPSAERERDFQLRRVMEENVALKRRIMELEQATTKVEH